MIVSTSQYCSMCKSLNIHNILFNVFYYPDCTCPRLIIYTMLVLLWHCGRTNEMHSGSGPSTYMYVMQRESVVESLCLQELHFVT